MSKLEELKNEADMMDISYDPKVTYKGLQKIIRDAGTKREDEIKGKPKPKAELAAAETKAKPLKQVDISMLAAGVDTDGLKMHPDESDYAPYKLDEEETDLKKAKKLIRIKVINMNPGTQFKESEQVQIWNADGPVAEKIVPFGQEWHVEKAIVDHLQAKTYQAAIEKETKTHGETGTKQIEIVYEERPEYGIIVLPPLTQKELDNLADDQRKTDRLKD